LSSGFKYLASIEQSLLEVLKAHPDVVLRVVSDQRPTLETIPPGRIEFIQWSPEVEVETVQGMTVGVMPLLDSLWERGKCSYKMLLYMSCGIPVVASPVGMNARVFGLGDIGFAARTKDDWVDAMTWLLAHSQEAQAMGGRGRKVVLAHFSLTHQADRLAAYMKTFT